MAGEEAFEPIGIMRLAGQLTPDPGHPEASLQLMLFWDTNEAFSSEPSPQINQTKNYFSLVIPSC